MPSDLGLSTALGWHGENPEKLDLIDIDPDKITADTIRGNLRNLPEAERYINQVNEFSTDQLLKQLAKMIPGYQGAVAGAVGNLASMARGEVPKDVERYLKQQAAERGVTLGTSGSEFEQYDTLRNLGLKSLDVMRTGIQGLQSWIANAPRTPQMNLGGFLFTPQQRLSYEFSQAQANLPIRQFNNWVDTLPSNLERGLAVAMDYSINIGTEYGEKWLGAYSPGGSGFSGTQFGPPGQQGGDDGGGGGGGGGQQIDFGQLMQMFQGMGGGGMGGMGGM